ncbi:MAG: cobalamin transport system permease protein [Chloroflexota bacterium]|jgi:iron complex transport system permease protein|nr:cobalamin transport system permease protein [Chloroflexota bacterium]
MPATDATIPGLVGRLRPRLGLAFPRRIDRPLDLRWRLVGAGSLLTVAVFAIVLVAATSGPARIPYEHVAAIFAQRVGLPITGVNASERSIVENIRLPRIVAGLLVGAALGIAGGVLQGLYRNPLADPGILGVSGGGALGAVLAIGTGLAAAHQLALPICAFTGALAAALTVAGIGLRRGGAGTSLVLAGIAVSALASAGTSAVLSLTEDRERNQAMLYWLLGGLDNRTWTHVTLIAGPILLGVAVCLAFSRELNLMLLGEESAQSLGVPVPAARAMLLAVVALITGVSVAVSGIVSFVGLMVPHAVRLVVGYDHRLVLPLSALAGAGFVVGADTLARLVIQPAELRLGIVTSALGAPFFVYLILRGRHARLGV